MPSWFAQLFGFKEGDWEGTQAQFAVEGEELVSAANGRRFAVGHFSTPSIAELRTQVAQLYPVAGATTAAATGTHSPAAPRRLQWSHVAVGDVLELHALPENAGATFQAASQFNCLEFPSPQCVPEDGVTGYAHDRTQGPACALAAAAATVYRNYLAPVSHSGGDGSGSGVGQRADRQINNLADLSSMLFDGGAGGTARQRPLFTVTNGYVDATAAELEALNTTVLPRHDRDALVAAVRLGVHARVGVTFASRWKEPPPPPPQQQGQRVSQAFASALSCAYSRTGDAALWAPLATIALDAAYEGTLLAAAVDAAGATCGSSEGRGDSGGGYRGSGVVWLTLVGGGVFGNDPEWIAGAIGRALRRCAHLPLDVRVAHYGRVDGRMRDAIDAAAAHADDGGGSA